MKKTLLLLPVLFIFVFPNSTHANSPKLYLPVSSYDFGEIYEGQTVGRVFILKNTGEAPLEIISVTPDCKCTKVRISTVQIKPCKQAELRITFSSRDQRGSFTNIVIIETNDPVEPVKMIKIKGTVVKKDA